MSDTTSPDFSPESLEALEFQTPFFLFSKDRILRRYEEFKKSFPGAAIHYAIKANSEIPVLQLLNDAGASFEAASKYELDYLKEAGVSADRIIYGTSVKSASHIKDFHEYGVDRYAADSFPELEKLAVHAPGARVYIRMTVNDTGSVFRFSEKFGTAKANVVPLLRHAVEIGLKPYGISFHVGSQASNPLAWAHALRELGEVLDELKTYDITIDALNFGGGFPCHYLTTEETSDIEEIAKFTLEEYEKLPYQPQIILEPGRGLIADTGVLVTSVIARVGRGENTWLFLDAGVYNALFEAMAYQGSTRYPITSMRPSYDSGEMLYALAGPTGDSPDVITREALLPRDIEIGDKLIIHKVGAYTLPATSPFNGFPKPPVYYV
jgi:ornithine decarboxylase